MKKAIKVTRDEFHTYEVIRYSGLTNMLDIEQVIDYSWIMGGTELTKGIIMEIQANYNKYLMLYPLPSNGVIKIKAIELKEEMVHQY